MQAGQLDVGTEEGQGKASHMVAAHRQFSRKGEKQGGHESQPYTAERPALLKGKGATSE